MKFWKTFFVGVIWLAAIAVFLLPIWFTPDVLLLNSGAATDILQTLLLLIFIALIVERAMEVFVMTVRAPGRAEKEADLGRLREQQAANPSSDSQTQIEYAEKDLASYKTHTQRVTLSLGLVLGFTISAVGIRTLEPLIQTEIFNVAEEAQKTLFRLADVLLTGGS